MRAMIIPWFPVVRYPSVRLCVRCRDSGVIVPADDASPDACCAHLAEDRANILIKGSGAWWA